MDCEFFRHLSELINRFLEDSTIDGQGNVEWVMNKAFVTKVNDLIIFINPDDHPKQPHFHVKSTQKHIEARFDIVTLELLSDAVIRIKDYKKIVWFFIIGSPSTYRKLKGMVSRLYTE